MCHCRKQVIGSHVKMAATPFSTAVSNSLSLVNATTTNADAPRSDPLGPPSRIARRTRRRLPPSRPWPQPVRARLSQQSSITLLRLLRVPLDQGQAVEG